jgi:DNA-binding LacI/PurR family transcriptional regulator
MGEVAVQLLADRFRNAARGNQHKQVPFQIVERESVVEFQTA